MAQHTFLAKTLEWEWNIILFGAQHLIGEFGLNGAPPSIPGDVLMGNKPADPSATLHFANGEFMGGARPKLIIRIPVEVNQTFHQTMWAQWDGAIIFFRTGEELDPESTERVPVTFTEGTDMPFMRFNRSLSATPSDDPNQL
jgi:hypothetical protein